MKPGKRVTLRNLLIALSAGFVLLISVAAIVSPARAQWEFEKLTSYLRGVVSPVGKVPADTGASSFQTQNFVLAPFVSAGSKEAKSEQSFSARLPVKIVLTAPTFDTLHDYQDWNNCGPSTLALALRMYGWKGDQNTIAKVIKPERQDKNVNIEELAAYAGSNAGLHTEIRYAGDLNRLKQFLAAGYPVIIEESFTLEQSFWPGDDLWSSHFVLLTGYEEEKAVFIAQDVYYGPNTKLDESKLLNDWKAFNYVYLVLFEPKEESAIKTLISEDWSQSANWQRAENQAEQQIQQNSQDIFAWFNLGTSLNGLQEYEKAWQAFNEARKLGLPQRMLRYQFGPFTAAYETGRLRDLTELITYTLKTTPNSEEVLVWQGKLFLIQNQPEKAKRVFMQALTFHPQYTEAEKAMMGLQ